MQVQGMQGEFLLGSVAAGTFIWKLRVAPSLASPWPTGTPSPPPLTVYPLSTARAVHAYVQSTVVPRGRESNPGMATYAGWFSGSVTVRERPPNNAFADSVRCPGTGSICGLAHCATNVPPATSLLKSVDARTVCPRRTFPEVMTW